MYTDSELLRQYVTDGSEAAFTELVHRYGALVYSAALRSVGGQGHLAAEVTQDVFILLVRKAPRLVRHETLAGWLHTTTRYVALRALHRQRQRDVREQAAVAMQTLTAPEIPWEQLRPLLDEAVGQLDDRDRNAVLLRYFQGLGHREVGAALGLNEDAARMRTERAVEKLRHYFARSGVVTSAALLAEALSANCAQAAPVGLLGSVAATSFAHGRNLGLGHSLLKAIYMTTNTKIILTAAILGAAFAVGWFSSDHVAARDYSPTKTASIGTSAKNLPLSPVDALAKARADLIKALRTPGKINSERALYAYVATLDAATAKALLADLITKPLTSNKGALNSDNNAALAALSYRWADLDPKAALAWLQEVQDSNVQNLCAPQIFDAYSSNDPVAALNALATLPSKFNFIQLAVNTLINSAKQNPQAVLAELQSLQSQPNGQKFIAPTQTLLQDWAEIDPAAAAAAALSLPANGIESMSSLRSVASTWAQQDPAAAIAWAKTLPEGQRNGVDNGIIMGMGQVDPAAAADYFMSIPNIQGGDLLLQQITRNWSQQDPTALLTWAGNNLTGTEYDNAEQMALRQMGQNNPAATAAYLAQNPNPDIASQVIPQLATAWAMQDAQAALTWAQSLPADDADLRNSAINKVFAGWSNTNPVAAAAYIQQNLAADPSFTTLVGQVVKSWGNADPQAALNWAQNLPSGDAQNNAVVTAIATLAKVEPQADAATAAQNAMDKLAGLTPAQQTALQKIAAKATSP